jgi:hypothetical protein
VQQSILKMTRVETRSNTLTSFYEFDADDLEVYQVFRDAGLLLEMGSSLSEDGLSKTKFWDWDITQAENATIINESLALDSIAEKVNNYCSVNEIGRGTLDYKIYSKINDDLTLIDEGTFFQK